MTARAVAVLAVLLIGGCPRSTNPDTDTITNSTVDDTLPEGIDPSKLDRDRQEIFYRLVDSLQSPCGKAHSLRTSYTSDTTCKRAPFAARYLIALLDDEIWEDKLRDEFKRKYESTAAPVKLDVSKAPRLGGSNAPVRLVEFFDYGCPHCAEVWPALEKVAATHKDQVVEYFMMFPLNNPTWPHSKSAAQAALAAHAQNRFKEMHALLFEKSPAHSEAEVKEYAKALGLDLAKFDRDYQAAAAQVDSDRAIGDAIGIVATPTIYINDRKYEGPMHAKYLGLWVDEEIAVNR